MVPKGKLLIIGGAEERVGSNLSEDEEGSSEQRFKILSALLPNDQGDGRIEVITTASKKTKEMQEIYQRTFGEIGYENIGFLHIRSRPQARDMSYNKRIEAANAVFFTGGDQLRLATIISGSNLASSIKRKYLEEKDFVVAGTSAGAMVMSKLMISSGGVNEALLGSDIQIASGLGLLENCIIDTHFIKRGRFSRLAHAVVLNPGNLGIGLGENTALMITNGDRAECIGSGMVILIDGSDIERTNISEVSAGDPVYVENLKVHLLVRHCAFNFVNHVMEIQE